MSTPDLIAERLKDLPAERQQEVLDFVDFIRSRATLKTPLRSFAGLWRGFDLPADAIDEARRELWAAFPRRDI